MAGNLVGWQGFILSWKSAALAMPEHTNVLRDAGWGDFSRHKAGAEGLFFLGRFEGRLEATSGCDNWDGKGKRGLGTETG